ncbi:CGNR zinc finger domain-containing protein [Microbacterium sp.]|uniref:CGNR zinc finger domain-containing protein n=1 Tax=Microbacterium sp. TaxID=51671 RepID=UPI00345C4C1D
MAGGGGSRLALRGGADLSFARRQQSQVIAFNGAVSGSRSRTTGPRSSSTGCDEVDCRWVFLDPSGRRRWCPAPACASRGRVRAHRAAAGRAPSSGV